MNPATATKLDRCLKVLLRLCAATAAIGLVIGFTSGSIVGVVLVLGSMAVAAAPAFHFAAKVAFIEQQKHASHN